MEPANHMATTSQQLARFATVGPVVSARDCIAAGVTLLAIRSSLRRGAYKDRVNQLGLTVSTAGLYTHAAHYFAEVYDEFIDAAGTAEKLLTLLQMSKDEAMSFASGCTVRELDPNALAAISVAELQSVLGRVRPQDVPSLTGQEELMLRRFRQGGVQARALLVQTATALAEKPPDT